MTEKMDKRAIAGVRLAIEWLHHRANSMNDGHAKAILHSAATNLGWDLRDYREGKNRDLFPAPHSNGDDALPSDAKSAGGEELADRLVNECRRIVLGDADDTTIDIINEAIDFLRTPPPTPTQGTHEATLGVNDGYLLQADAIGEDVAVEGEPTPSDLNRDSSGGPRKAEVFKNESKPQPAPADVEGLVERLRRGPYVTVGDVTDLMDLADWQELADEAAAALLAMQRRLDTCRKRRSGEVSSANEQNRKLREALEKIEIACGVSSHPHCLTAYQIARAALNRSEGQ